MISKSERHEVASTIFSSRHEGGVRAIHAWLLVRREEINARWPTALHVDLPLMQGEATLVAQLIRVIEQGPSIKTMEVTDG